MVFNARVHISRGISSIIVFELASVNPVEFEGEGGVLLHADAPCQWDSVRIDVAPGRWVEEGFPPILSVGC